MQALEAVQNHIVFLNAQLASPDVGDGMKVEFERQLWRALDREAELYNQLSSLSTPEPEAAPEQATPEPEPVAVENVQKEGEEPVEQSEPVPGYIIEKVQTDVTLYTEQLAVFDKAIESQAFAELSEDEQARRLRSREHLAGYLEEAKEELDSFGPLFDELNVIEPAEELEQELERQNAPDLASDFDVLFNSEPEPEIAQVVSTADELADLQAKVNQAKALADKNQQLQAEKAVIESELADLERQLEQIFSGGYNEFSDIEAAKIQREIEVRQRCKREIMAHFESPESIVPAWAKWQDRIDELTPSPEPEVLEPVSDEAIKNLASVIRGGLQSLVNEKIQERSEPAKPKKPAVKPVKADQIGTVTPTPEQLREAVLEILSREPGFANRATLDITLPGAPWLFNFEAKESREMLTGVLSGLMDNGVIEFFSTENGLFLRLATLSTPSEPDQNADNPKCLFCNSPAKETPGQLLWKCTKNEAHYFYVGDKNGVWRNAENKDIESVTVPLPVWTKSAVPHKFEPRCEYCNGDMQAINGNPGQWRCLGNIYHSFYVSNGRGVWVDNSGTFEKQITEMPIWAKKEG